jgi:hypothetical protein
MVASGQGRSGLWSVVRGLADFRKMQEGLGDRLAGV